MLRETSKRAWHADEANFQRLSRIDSGTGHPMRPYQRRPSRRFSRRLRERQQLGISRCANCRAAAPTLHTRSPACRLYHGRPSGNSTRQPRHFVATVVAPIPSGALIYHSSPIAASSRQAPQTQSDFDGQTWGHLDRGVGPAPPMRRLSRPPTTVRRPEGDKPTVDGPETARLAPSGSVSTRLRAG